MGRFVTDAAVSYYHGWKLVFRKFARVVDSIYKHYADRICVLAMAKPTADDLRRLDDVCAVCGTAMDADSSRLTPCLSGTLCPSVASLPIVSSSADNLTYTIRYDSRVQPTWTRKLSIQLNLAHV